MDALVAYGEVNYKTFHNKMASEMKKFYEKFPPVVPDPETDDEGLPLEGHVLGSEPAALPAVGSHVRLAARSFNTEDDDDVDLNSTLDKAVPQPTDSPSGVASLKTPIRNRHCPHRLDRRKLKSETF